MASSSAAATSPAWRTPSYPWYCGPGVNSARTASPSMVNRSRSPMGLSCPQAKQPAPSRIGQPPVVREPGAERLERGCQFFVPLDSVAGAGAIAVQVRIAHDTAKVVQFPLQGRDFRCEVLHGRALVAGIRRGGRRLAAWCRPPPGRLLDSPASPAGPPPADRDPLLAGRRGPPSPAR